VIADVALGSKQNRRTRASVQASADSADAHACQQAFAQLNSARWAAGAGQCNSQPPARDMVRLAMGDHGHAGGRAAEN